MNEFWEQVLEFCQQITQEVGDRLIEDCGILDPVAKQDGSLVTKADRWADHKLRDAISETFPEHGVLTEETTHIFPKTDWCWIIDPIDGTTNFTRGIPIWAISLGLLYKGTPVFGFVYLPFLKQTFHGYWYGNSGLTGDTGAYLNNQPIKVTQDSPSKSHLFNLCARSLAILQRPFPCKVRMIGVATYNILLVATGAAIGGIEATPKIWDIAAVWVILQAAGGSFTSLGKDQIFPLEAGKNYGNISFPTLALCRQELVPTFKTLADIL
ncbi:MAG: inositol monophosphatase family protein [Xenococcus sp. (in: cyanobacteria)]